MGGLYPDAPGKQVAYDRDGTLGFIINSAGTTFTAITTPQLQALNDDDVTAGPAIAGGGFLTLMFPETRDLVGAFRSISSASNVVETSANTTNGFDGTWTQVQSGVQGIASGTVQPSYRTTIHTFTATAVKAIRIKNNAGGSVTPLAFHVYGNASAATDRLELWHPTLDQPLYSTAGGARGGAMLDYDDKQRNTGPHDLTFRLKNMSSTLTAGSITVSMEALTDAASPTHVSEFTFKYDAGAFGSTATLSSLAANTISSALFTVRFAPGATSNLGVWRQRILAIASSWT